MVFLLLLLLLVVVVVVLHYSIRMLLLQALLLHSRPLGVAQLLETVGGYVPPLTAACGWS